MHEVIADIDRWRETESNIALATVIHTWGSAPRKTGAKMAIAPSNLLSGSVSGGCVEGAVYDAGIETLATGQPQLLQFGVADETAWEVGLACGGSISVWVEPVIDATYEKVREILANDEAGAIVTVLSEGAYFGRKRIYHKTGSTGSIDPPLDSLIDSLAQEAIQSGTPLTASALDPITASPIDLFVDVLLPAAQLIMVGGVHIAQALTGMAKMLGYRTVVVDPRRAFGTDERFPNVDELIQQWPKKAFSKLTVNENTAVALLTHDPKIDDPAITSVIDSQAFYIGALGSRKTHAKRKQRLADKGFSEAQIGRIHGPIGLDIKAHNPEEIALSVLAEIVAARRGALG